MGRKRESVKKREDSNNYEVDRSILDPLDYKELPTFTGTVSDSELIVRNENNTGAKVPVRSITDPLNARIDSVEEEVSRKADKCLVLAMSIVL